MAESTDFEIIRFLGVSLNGTFDCCVTFIALQEKKIQLDENLCIKHFLSNNYLYRICVTAGDVVVAVACDVVATSAGTAAVAGTEVVVIGPIDAGCAS